MAKYSSDSDSDRSNRHRRKHYRRSRSSSSDSSESSSHRKRPTKYSRSKRRHRSKSKSRERERSSKSYKSARPSSRERDKRRYRSKKSRSHSADRSKRRAKSASREKSTSRSSSAQSGVKPTAEKAPGSFSKDDFSIEPMIKESVLDEINSESFAPKSFVSSASTKDTKFKNVVIDVSADTIQAPTIKCSSNVTESIFHTSIMMDQEARFDKWVKKLYTLRQKAIVDVAHTSVT